MKKFNLSKQNTIFLIGFLMCTIIPLAFINTKYPYVSELDNKNFSQIPKLGTTGFTQNFDNYLNERIGGRDFMIEAYEDFNLTIFKELVHPNYSIGKKGHYFPKMHTNIKYGDYHEKFVNMTDKINKYCNLHGASFYLIFDPEKQSVYRNFLPDGINYDNKWVSEFVDKCKQKNIKVIDNTELLINKAKSEKVYNTKFDSAHWNALGAFYGIQNLSLAIHQDFEEVPILDKNMFNVSSINEQYLGQSRILINEQVPQFKLMIPYSSDLKKWNGKISLNKNYTAFFRFLNQSNNADKLPNALVFQGSYINHYPELLIPLFRQYTGIHNYQNILNLPYYFEIFKPDIVILDVAEYVFDDRYFDSSQMQNINW